MSGLLKSRSKRGILGRNERKRHSAPIKLGTIEDSWLAHGRHVEVKDSEAWCKNDRIDGSNMGTCAFGDLVVNRGTTVWILRILKSRGGIVLGITSDPTLDPNSNFTTSSHGYGYGASGNKYHHRKVSKFSESFHDGDVVTVNLDLESNGKRVLSFCKNTDSQGVAFKNIPEAGFRLAVLMSQPDERVALLRCMCNEEKVGNPPPYVAVTPPKTSASPRKPIDRQRPHSESPTGRRSARQRFKEQLIAARHVPPPPPPPALPRFGSSDIDVREMKVADNGNAACLGKRRHNSNTGPAPPSRPRSRSPDRSPPSPPMRGRRSDKNSMSSLSPPQMSTSVLTVDGPLSISAATLLSPAETKPPPYDRIASAPVSDTKSLCQKSSCRMDRAKVSALLAENRQLRQKLEKKKERIQTLEETNKTWLRFYRQERPGEARPSIFDENQISVSVVPKIFNPRDMSLDDVPPLPPPFPPPPLRSPSDEKAMSMSSIRTGFSDRKFSHSHSNGSGRRTFPMDQDDLKTVERPETSARKQRYSVSSSSSLFTLPLVSEFERWLTVDVQLPEYMSIFYDNGFDRMDILSTLSLTDLEEMGITKKGHQRILLRAISSLDVAHPSECSHHQSQPGIGESDRQHSLGQEGRAHSMSQTSVTSDELFGPGSPHEREGPVTLRYLTPGHSSKILARS